MTIPKSFRKYLLFAIGTMLLASTAYAGNFWEPEGGWATDSSVKFMAAVFGGVIYSITAGTISDDSKTILSTLLSVMNSGVLVVGMIIMAYTYIGGAIHTAKDGEWLGRKWDTMMVPLRTAAGMAMLLPTIAGYSFLQIILLWCGLQAVGLSSSIWKAAYSQFSKEQLISKPYIATNKTAEQVYLMATCRAAGDKFGWNVNETGGADKGYITYNVKSVLTATGSGACGTISWSQTPLWKSIHATGAAFLNGNNGSASGSAYIDGDNPLFSFMGTQPTIVTGTAVAPTSSVNIEGPDSIYLLNNNETVKFEENVRAAHGKIISEMLAGTNGFEMLALATKVVDASDATKKSYMPGGDYYNFVGRAQNLYERRLAAEISKHVADDIFKSSSDANIWLVKMQDQMKTGGWIHAGSFYMKVGHLNNAVQRKINQVVQSVYTLPDIEKMQNASQNSEFAAFLINVKESLNGSRELSKTVDNSVGSENMMQRVWQRVTGAFSDSFLNFAMVGKLGAEGLDPLVQMKNIGDTILVTAETAMVLSSDTIVNALGGKDSGSSGSGGTSIIGTIVAMLVGVMFAMGMFLSIILPMLPYMLWVAGVAFWFITFVQAVVAAPLWAIAHMHPEGHDVAGRGSPGYMFALVLLTKPALMIIFLFSAMLLIKPIMVFVNQGFFEAISNMTEGSAAGIVTLIGTIVMYSAIATNMIFRTFGMINTGPDAVYRWIGGHDSVGTESNNDAMQNHSGSRGSMGSVQPAFQSVGRAIGSKFGGGSGRGNVVASSKK